MVNAPEFRVIGNRKYGWDGAIRHDAAEAARAAETYRSSGFDVQIVAEGDEFRLFTRRQAAGDASHP